MTRNDPRAEAILKSTLKGRRLHRAHTAALVALWAAEENHAKQNNDWTATVLAARQGEERIANRSLEAALFG